MQNQCLSLWIGEKLGPVERACLSSVLRQGHRVALYCYSHPVGLPADVEIRDAATVLPENAVFQHRSGSFAFFADWFRYELLKRGEGTWIDTDMYLLKPLDMRSSSLFGQESAGVINNAVLRLRPDSPVLPLLLEPFEKRRTPAASPLRSSWMNRVREWFGAKANFTELPWGSTGPLALTKAVRDLSLMGAALDPDVLYPVHWHNADWIRDPAQSLEDRITPRTIGVHLWNACIAAFKNEPAPAGSFLHRLQQEGA